MGACSSLNASEDIQEITRIPPKPQTSQQPAESQSTNTTVLSGSISPELVSVEADDDGRSFQIDNVSWNGRYANSIHSMLVDLNKNAVLRGPAIVYVTHNSPHEFPIRYLSAGTRSM